MDDDIWGALRADAARHEPDRELMLIRIDGVRSRPKRFRPLVVAAAAASVLVTATLVGWSLSERPPRPVATPATSVVQPAVSEPAGPVPVPKTAAPSTGTGPSAEVSEEPSADSSTAPAAPGVTVRAWTDPVSGEYWMQQNLTVTVAKPLRAFTATIRIGTGTGEEFAGVFTTLSIDDLTVTTRTEAGKLLYRWTLRPGRTVRAGEYQFSAQFKRTPGTRTTADTYEVGPAHGRF